LYIAGAFQTSGFAGVFKNSSFWYFCMIVCTMKVHRQFVPVSVWVTAAIRPSWRHQCASACICMSRMLCDCRYSDSHTGTRQPGSNIHGSGNGTVRQQSASATTGYQPTFQWVIQYLGSRWADPCQHAN
jgi:hypothetical protein